MRLKQSLENKLVDRFVKNESMDWVKVNISSTMIHLILVSQVFEGLSYNERKNKVNQVISLTNPYTEGFWDLYTPKEAEMEGVERPEEKPPVKRLYTWNDLVDAYKNNIPLERDGSNFDKTKVISFYSHKGGVGRTVALSHVAYLLASQGKKVVIVDLDIEAPSFYNIFDPDIYEELENGLVDYFYDRICKSSQEMEHDVEITDIFTELKFELKYNQISGRLFMVPAGRMNLEYIERADFIKARLVTRNKNDYWAEFMSEIISQLNPDYILVDSRTGLNEWGALSLLTISDSVFFFLYPNKENVLGTGAILKPMKEVGYDNYNVIFSRIHDDKIGRINVKKYWDQLLTELHGDNQLDKYIKEPISIYYESKLAVADYYPIDQPDYFNPLVDLIIEDTNKEDWKQIIEELDKEMVLDSIEVSSNGYSPDTFQKPTYLDKYFGEEVNIITGARGTGKTMLYNMTANHFDKLKEYSIDKLDNVIPIELSLNGSVNKLSYKNDFDYGYMLFEILISLKEEKLGFDFNEVVEKQYNQIQTTIKPNSVSHDYEDIIVKITLLLDLIDSMLEKHDKKIWFVYETDKLDRSKDILIKKLLNALYTISVKSNHINFKIFIEQDRWDNLDYQKKNKFKGKTIITMWKKVDFLRMTLEIFAKHNILKEKVFDRYKESSIDQIYKMKEPELEELLRGVWGFRTEDLKYSRLISDWIFEKLSNQKGHIYPGVVKEFIIKAIENEKINTKKNVSQLLSLESIRTAISEVREDS